ncbi:hypothetical protein QVZ41_02675 [Wenyingzhuangia sp. chi5]|uniref:Uncharacterized protein n=1 Tax=Wenyingzhuangia gilva TaxID=3057677 RepID=A0ABT8VP64_9FLAO|nr:hypothetical protein [Wenyingzhuangia sp. chi5]MDO3693751.1 hypothetical protein [Wenyingzhuangia sp. chi5]
MKKTIYVISLLFVICCTLSCESDDLNYQNDFKNSEKAWISFKQSSNNSYQYIVTGGSVFTTYGWETTITVYNGVIIKRHFKYNADPENIPEENLEWTENENEINSEEHQYTSAATALTLDEVYDKAKKEWLIKRKDVSIYFETENNGLISTCGYVPKNCMDDCFYGITIKSIETLSVD